MLTMLEPFIRPGLARRVIYGAVGGLYGAGAMKNVTNIAAHVRFGLTVQVLTEEAARQGKRRPTSDGARRMTRVG